MKCLECSSELRESKFKSLTGYDTYRCTKCNALFDISDLNSNSSFSLKMPLNLRTIHEKHFSKLIENNSVNFPVGGGKSMFIAAVMNHNSGGALILPSQVLKQNYKGRVNQSNIYFAGILRKNISELRNYKYIIIEELYERQYQTVLDILKKNDISLPVFYVNCIPF